MMQRNLSIDILKLVMSFLIVGLHGHIFEDFSPMLSYLFVDGIARIGVPVFLIINGFYFYEIKSKDKFKNWIQRWLYLYVIWMIVYSTFWFDSPLDIFRMVFGYWHLWYLISAIYAFLLIWIIRKLNVKQQITSLILCGISGLLLQYSMNYNLITYPSFHTIGVHVYRNGLFFCFPFIMIGYFINKFSLYKKEINWMCLLFVGLFLLLLESFFNYQYNEKAFDVLISLYLFCPVLFIYTLNKNFSSNNKTVALYSTGIYLIHDLISQILKKTIPLPNTPCVIVTFLLSVLMSFFLIKIKKKFKYIL